VLYQNPSRRTSAVLVGCVPPQNSTLLAMLSTAPINTKIRAKWRFKNNHHSRTTSVIVGMCCNKLQNVALPHLCCVGEVRAPAELHAAGHVVVRPYRYIEKRAVVALNITIYNTPQPPHLCCVGEVRASAELHAAGHVVVSGRVCQQLLHRLADGHHAHRVRVHLQRKFTENTAQVTNALLCICSWSSLDSSVIKK
jgi:hypothetical protein